MSATTYKVDDEIKPTVEALQQETAHLLELAKEIYVPANVADTVIGEVLPVHQQLLLYVVSAHVALSSMFCQRKLANEPIPEKLTQQILRVQGYLKKLKEHGIDINAANAALPTAAPTAASSAASRRNLDARGQGNRRGGAGAPGSGGADTVNTNEQEALLLTAGAATSSTSKLTGNRREREQNEEVGKKVDEKDDGYLRFSEDTEKKEEEKRKKKIDPLVAQRVGQLATQGAKRRDV